MEPLRRNLSGGVQAAAADIYVSYIHICVYLYISRTYIDAEFDVESDGMVYLASKGHLHQDICDKYAFFLTFHCHLQLESAKCHRVRVGVRFTATRGLLQL